MRTRRVRDVWHPTGCFRRVKGLITNLLLAIVPHGYTISLFLPIKALEINKRGITEATEPSLPFERDVLSYALRTRSPQPILGVNF